MTRTQFSELTINEKIELVIESGTEILNRIFLFYVIRLYSVEDFYVEVWFEARAMIGQFRKYAPNVVLRPFGGFTSIPFKYEIAKDLER